MEILWPALAIAAIVVFVFYILAQHWQRVLHQQTLTIRRLFERVQNLEDMVDPEFRRRIGDAAPMPLERVFTFSFRLDDRFWRDSLGASEEDRKFIRECGSLVGSVKVERWRSHTVATITEVLPDGTAGSPANADWQSRSLDFYEDSTRSSDALTLWELALSRPVLSAERPPSLELILRRNWMELWGHLLHRSSDDSGTAQQTWPERDEVIFFRVPLDTAQLAEFKTHDPANYRNNGSANPGASEPSSSAGSWQAFYFHRNEALGLEWQLRVRDLTKKSEWERWGILDSGTIAPIQTEEN
jgi:hypothetical protein